MAVYLDHAASTPLRDSAREAMLPLLTQHELMGNPSSAHEYGRNARAALELARSSVAAQFAADPGDVIFNSGGSEGDTHAVFGAMRLMSRLRARPLTIAISAFEHEAVRVAAELCGELGHRVHVMQCDGQGVVPLEEVDLALKDRADIVSLMSVNNEIGTVQPVGEAALLCSRAGALFHTDGVRAAGHGLRVICKAEHIPLINATGHKFGGPRGIGFLIARRAQIDATLGQDCGPFPQLVCGVKQEHYSRAGTENVAGAVGLATALELCRDDEAGRLERLRAALEGALRERFPACVIHGEGALRATHITSVAFPGANGPELAGALEAAGVLVGAGSACHSSGGSVGSQTLRAMGVAPQVAGGTLRISLGWNTEEADTDMLRAALESVLKAQGWLHSATA